VNGYIHLSRRRGIGETALIERFTGFFYAKRDLWHLIEQSIYDGGEIGKIGCLFHGSGQYAGDNMGKPNALYLARPSRKLRGGRGQESE
jgi:hypothetical protein